MKKSYNKPMAEKIEFDYRIQIVASGGENPISPCIKPVNPSVINPGQGHICAGITEPASPTLV